MIRTFILVFIAALPLLSAAQQQPVGTDTLRFVSLGDSTFAVPQGCLAGSPYQIQCEDYQVAWLYFPPEQVRKVLESNLGAMARNLPNFTKEKATLYLFGQKLDGYKLHFMRGEIPVHQLITCGPVGDKAAIVQVVMYQEINSDDDLPPFARNILRLNP